MTQQTKATPLSRRTLLAAAGVSLAAPIVAAGLAKKAQAQAAPKAPASVTARSGLNILYVFTDQQRYHAKWPKGLSLPGQERLQRTGTSFLNHYTAAAMCTSSRAVMLTG